MIAITVSTPASIASSIEAAAKRAGTKIIEVLAPASETASAILSKTGTPSTSCAALPGGDPGDEVGAVVAVAKPVEGALAAGQAGDDQLGVGADDDAHAAQPSRELHDSLGGAEHRLLLWRSWRSASARIAQALLGVGAVEADDQRAR